MAMENGNLDGCFQKLKLYITISCVDWCAGWGKPEPAAGGGGEDDVPAGGGEEGHGQPVPQPRARAEEGVVRVHNEWPVVQSVSNPIPHSVRAEI